MHFECVKYIAFYVLRSIKVFELIELFRLFLIQKSLLAL